MTLIRLLLVLLIQGCASFDYDLIFTTGGHTELVTAVAFFKDQRRYITGSSDNKAKVWSIRNHNMLHEFTFADDVMNIGLHPVDNRIFVLIYDGSILIYDPVTYALVYTLGFPGTAANYITFEQHSDRFLIGGYEGSGLAPVLYIFNSTDYNQISSITTGLPVDDQINTISLNPDCTHVVISNLANIGTVYKLEVYRLSDSALVNTFTDATDKIRWTTFSNDHDFFCSTSRDKDVRCYMYEPATSQYVMRKNWQASDFPYCMTFGFVDTMVITVGTEIQFFITQLETQFLRLYLTVNDVASIFVIANTPSLQYMVTGMGNGSISLWEFIPDQEYSPEQGLAQYYQKRDQTKNLAIGLGVGLGSLAIIIILSVTLYMAGCCRRCRKKENKPQDQSMNGLILEEGKDNFIVIKDYEHKSNISSDIDYDELMVHGTVIIIKDEDKKRKYIEKLKKKQEQDGNIKDSDIDKFLDVQGNIIIIRDDDHSEYRKNKKNFSDKSSDLDYEQLMAEGNVIIIKDDDTKKSFINKLKKKDNDTDYTPLMVEGNIIIIRGEEQQKVYLKELNKKQDLKNIKHDLLLAEGDVIVIKDEDKKKEFVDKMKKELQKNNQNLKNLAGIEIAQQIIVICGDDDEDVTYEMLMAQGTVIVIKDDDTKQQYAKYLRKQNKKRGDKDIKGSEKSSNPDYDTLMAQQCIIVIKDEDDKRNYANFMKHRKGHSDKSSEMNYDELMNNGNIMNIQDDNRAKRNNSSGVLISGNRIQIKPNNNMSKQDFAALMAQKNVIVINDESAQPINQSQIKEISKTFTMRQ